MAEFRLETGRLVLRSWREDDALAHNALCGLEPVIAALGRAPSLDQSREVVARQQALQVRLGHCFWVLEWRASPGLAGWCGIQPGKPPIEGETEIGWTLHPALWGQGLAREAAAAVLAWCWNATDLDAVAAITSQGNLRSRKVMEAIGMDRRAERDFDHPQLEPGDPLRRHVFYRIKRPS